MLLCLSAVVTLKRITMKTQGTPVLVPMVVLLFLALAVSLYSQPSTPYLWLRADTAVVASNGYVVEWHDVSDNHLNFVQVDTAMQPMVLDNLKDGPASISFDGTDFLTGPNAFPTNTDYTLFLVVRINNLKATNNVLSGTTYAHYFGGNAYAKVLHGNFATLAIAGIPVAQSKLTLVRVQYNETTQRASVWINGSLADSSFVGSNTDASMYLGAYRKANFLDGDIAEVLLYNRLLPPNNTATTERYLASKFGIALPAQADTTFAIKPQTLQLYARGRDDSAAITIAGAISQPDFDSIYVDVLKNNVPWKHAAAPLIYANGKAPFHFAPTIHAEFAEYTFHVRMRNFRTDTLVAVWDSVVCGDVLFVDGQSNSIFGNGRITTSEYCRTFGKNFSHALGDTTWALANAYGNGGGTQVGAWCFTLQQMLSKYAGVPVCIINGGVGGTTIEQHRRDTLEPNNQNTIYGSMLYRAQKSALANKGRIMFWYQGESNAGEGYYEKFIELYNNWKNDYPALEKIYVVQIRPGCGLAEHGMLRETLRTLSDSLPDVECYSPMGVAGHDGCHYVPAGYDTIGTQIFAMVAKDFYGSTDTIDVGSPNVRSVYFADSTHRTITVELSHAVNGLHATPDTTIATVHATIAKAFLLNDSVQAVTQVDVEGNKLHLFLDSAFTTATLTYIPDKTYPGTTVVYEGPWIFNERGYGACSFYRVPVNEPQLTTVNSSHVHRTKLLVYPTPAKTELTISFTSQDESTYQVQIFNINGEVVWRTSLNAIPGYNDLHANITTLLNGVYGCRITTMHESLTTTFVIDR